MQAINLINSVKRTTGLLDFGIPPVLPALEVLLDSIVREAQLTESGLKLRYRHIERLLTNRLYLTDLLNKHQNFRDSKTGALLVIVGMPRSGTTKIHRMLSRDSMFNFITTWENLFPVPLLNSTHDRDIRKYAGAVFTSSLRKHSPECCIIHPFDADEPEEETWLMQHSFLTESIDTEIRVPSYLRWLKTQNPRPIYEQLNLWLQVLAKQHKNPDAPWLLKGTFHGAYLDVLMSVFPQAKIVYCHRDPLQSVPSYCSLVEKLRSLQSNQVDKYLLGQELLQNYSTHQTKTMSLITSLPINCLLEITYEDILTNMPNVIQRVYDFANIPLTKQAFAKMINWENRNQQYQYGTHKYKAEDYGLTAHAIAQVCRKYRNKYISTP